MADDKKIWYDPQKLFSYNKLLNFVMSPRSTGKTYSMKKFVIKKFLKDGSQFVYLRRFKTELRTSVLSFFNDIQQEFPDVEFKIKGNNLYINGNLAGVCTTLTSQTQIRGLSMPNFRTLIFDEFVLGNSSLRYLKSGTGEVDIFLEVLSTLIRNKNNNDMRIICLANSISYVNPYFTYFGLRVPIDKQGQNCFIYSNSNTQAILQLYVNENHKKMMEDTRFGELISGSAYSDYAIGNVTLTDNTEFIRPKMNIDKHSKFKFLCSFKVDNKELGLWFSETEGAHFNYKIDPSSKERVCLTNKDHTADYLRISSIKNRWYVMMLRDYYNNNLVYYQSQEVESICRDILGMLGIK